MKISEEERLAIQTAVALGNKFGFGNLIEHLTSAWAIVLMREGLDEADALKAASGRSGYPIQMHRDIVERGEWDETGARYQKKKPTTKAKR